MAGDSNRNIILYRFVFTMVDLTPVALLFFCQDSADEADGNGDDSTSDVDPDDKGASDGEDSLLAPRWKRTDDVQIPGTGFCKDATARWFVDSTVSLLEKSTERTFPGLVPSHGYDANSAQRHKRQRVMYRVLRKVLICEGEDGEKMVYRATGDEITNAVPDVKRGVISKDEYMKAVLKRCTAGPAFLDL